tara:strand:+ start:339 stop:440 length:102 start_codon:yes stop_codon:yes gene_type:complete
MISIPCYDVNILDGIVNRAREKGMKIPLMGRLK